MKNTDDFHPECTEICPKSGKKGPVKWRAMKKTTVFEPVSDQNSLELACIRLVKSLAKTHSIPPAELLANVFDVDNCHKVSDSGSYVSRTFKRAH